MMLLGVVVHTVISYTTVPMREAWGFKVSVVGSSFARFVARDWIAEQIPARLHNDDALARSPFQTVAVLRLVLWMPQVLHYFFGVSKVSFATHFWGSLVGYVPPLLLVSYLGATMFDASGSMQPAALPVMAALALASLVIAVLARVYGRRRSFLASSQLRVAGGDWQTQRQRVSGLADPL